MAKVRKPFALHLSPRFLSELQAQIDWIAEHNLKAAEVSAHRVHVAVRRLTRFPELGRVGRVQGSRELIVPRTRFVIAYRLSDAAVEVMALRHSKQAWPTKF